MKLAFTKMQGAGNDFVVLDCTTEAFALSATQLKKIADRHFGIGCDQILVVERPQDPAADFRYRIFNADGGEVEQCGNGARCFVKFVHARGLTSKSEIRVETLGGTIRPRLEADGEVSVGPEPIVPQDRTGSLEQPPGTCIDHPVEGCAGRRLQAHYRGLRSWPEATVLRTWPEPEVAQSGLKRSHTRRAFGPAIAGTHPERPRLSEP